MVICQFFLSGSCRFGVKCFNEHIDLKQLIKGEIDSAINGNQWPISCFGPFKDRPCVPNFIEDQSFEEVRYRFYEAKLTGNYEQVQMEFINMIQQSKHCMKLVSSFPPEVLNVFVQLYDSGSESAKQASTTANPFATNITDGQTNQMNIFGKSTFGNTSQQSAGNMFSSISSTPSPGMFANSSQTSTNNIFGQNTFAPTAQATSHSNGIFGGNQTQISVFSTPTANANPFGQPASSTFSTGNNTQSPFSLPQQQPQQISQPSNNIFGQQNSFGVTSQQTAPPVPSTNIFGNTSASIFGNPAPVLHPTQTNQNPQFGQTSVFGPTQTQPQQSTNVFQQQNHLFSNNTNNSLFQTGTPLQNSNIFGTEVGFNNSQQQSVLTQPSPFGTQDVSQTPITSNMSPFQQPAFAIVPQQQTFQNKSNFSGSEGVKGSMYSNVNELIQEQLDAFRSESFQMGRIPTVPPPKELC